MQYIAPHSLEDAVQLLLDRPDAKVLAGGTDLLVRMRSDMADPETILDIKRIDAMRTITQEDGGWRIGAAVSGAEMGEHAGARGRLARRGRSREPDRLDPDPGPRHDGGQPVQRLARRRQRAGDGRRRGDRARRRPERHRAMCRWRISRPRPGKTSLGKGEFVASIFLPAKAGAIGGRLSALHSAHRNGHRRGRLRRVA